MLLSARLSSTAVKHLLGASGAEKLLVSSRTRNRLIEDLHNAQIFTARSFDSFLGGDEFDDFSTKIAGAQAVRGNDNNVLLLHSSGTTGK